jgi:glucuronate isomerase
MQLVVAKSTDIAYVRNPDVRTACETYIDFVHQHLGNPLWRWATKKMEEKWGVSDTGDRLVTTTLPEDYEHVNMS